MKYFQFFVIMIFLAACSSPQKMYNNGNYSGALYQLTKKIKKGKAKREDVALAQKSMDKLDQELLAEISQLKSSGKINKLKKAYKKYDNVIEKHRDFGKLVRFDNERVRELEDEKELLRVDIVDYNMSEGYLKIAESFDRDDKHYAREAYKNFIEAEKYGADYEELDSLIELSFHRSVLYYAIDINDRNSFFYGLDNVEDFSGDWLVIEETFVCNECDCEIDLDIDRIDIRDYVEESTKTYRKNIQNGTETQTDTSGNTVQVPVYKDITAEVITRELIKEARVEANLNVYKRTQSCKISNEFFRIEVESDGVEYIVTGDERAVPSNALNIERIPDSDRDMIEQLYEILYKELENEIRN